MRKTILTGASLIALAASPAFAQSTSDVNQQGDGNSATVTQENSNSVDIDQIGNSNIATADQSGDGNESIIEQSGNGPNNADVTQGGEDSFADIFQTGNSVNNTASITQAVSYTHLTLPTKRIV